MPNSERKSGLPSRWACCAQSGGVPLLRGDVAVAAEVEIRAVVVEIVGPEQREIIKAARHRAGNPPVVVSGPDKGSLQPPPVQRLADRCQVRQRWKAACWAGPATRRTLAPGSLVMHSHLMQV